MKPCRHLVLVLGDQLDEHSLALSDFDATQDRVFMAEVREESTHVWSTRLRTAFFFSAMRHFAETLRLKGIDVDYQTIGAHQAPDLVTALATAIKRHRPKKVLMAEPGDWRVEQALRAFAAQSQTNLVLREDAHFMCSRREFAEWARGYKQIRMEFFYRMMRKRYDIMMEGDKPLQGRWNFDTENRGAFPKTGPGVVPGRLTITPDAITLGTIADVNAHFADHPGTLDDFQWPVTRKDALLTLQLFMRERLARFGEFQDAMWAGEPFLYHAHISAAMNVKLLNPREVIAAAIAAFNEGRAPIEAVEGFVRQVLGWREFIRGLYWLDMPAMRDANHFGHQRPLPAWYWTGATQMHCMQQTITQTLTYGYAHHIQRLMVTGIFGLLAETAPQQLEDWYLAVYVDAVEWVELPNVAGMALFANNGRFTSKPYIASGQYIKRMSNYCSGCRYKPDLKTGSAACPFTTLYWNFLDKHEKMLTGNPRTALMVRNVARLSAEERAAIREQAESTLGNLDNL